MADKDQGADKTEQPTPKKLRDARKEGNVAKSKELTSTVLVMGWLCAAWMLLDFVGGRVVLLFDQSLQAVGQPFADNLPRMAMLAVDTLLWILLPLFGMAFVLGLLIEFLQAGPVASMKKLVPKMDKMNPVEGIKKMFSMDNLVELVKAFFKSVALIFIGGVVLYAIGRIAQVIDRVCRARARPRP